MREDLRKTGKLVVDFQSLTSPVQIYKVTATKMLLDRKDALAKFGRRLGIWEIMKCIIKLRN